MPMSTPHPDTLTASTMYALRCAAYSALAFHIWEWMIGFPFELTHIWRKPHSSAVKWQYFGSRYIGIAAQIGNTIVSEYIHSSYERITWHFCLRLHIQQLVVCQWLLFSLEFSLIQRLIALSGRDAVLKFSLCVLVLAEHITLMASSVTMFRRLELIGACLAHRPCIEVAVNACAVCTAQFVLWGLTIHHSWKKKVPLTSLVMRDGSWVFGIVSILVIGGTVDIFAPKRRPGFNPFSPFVAVMASSNCHIILNLETMPQKQRDNISVTEFTSYIDTGGCALEVQSSHPSQLFIADELRPAARLK